MFSFRSVLLVAVALTAACNRSAPANVAAMVNGRAITYADLEKRLHGLCRDLLSNPVIEEYSIERSSE